ncbi:hypothetical protein T265_05824 [Opisthorchis viverrini]|uniref:Uncharacterized protein n=1 Tax=Opisthorchis viverrini TaxID=6198 RepID=A0A074ZUK7_OPIVI|nr:hypothetical protein T265_05824 [Opisthorchis viverrini]KER27065.1 hypothetical protein T265_05824 [Opisthorchis viverrini]
MGSDLTNTLPLPSILGPLVWPVSGFPSRKTEITSAAEFAGNGFHTSLPSHCLTTSGSLPPFTWLCEKSPSRKGRQHRCFHKYGHAGRLGETPYCLHTPVAEDSTTLPPDRLVARLLVVRGLAAPLWPSWHGCTLWNEVSASVACGIAAALKPDHHVKVAALGRGQQPSPRITVLVTG